MLALDELALHVLHLPQELHELLESPYGIGGRLSRAK
jgi:hypothetical protein